VKIIKILALEMSQKVHRYTKYSIQTSLASGSAVLTSPVCRCLATIRPSYVDPTRNVWAGHSPQACGRAWSPSRVFEFKM